MSDQTHTIEPLGPTNDPAVLQEALGLVLRLLPEPTAEALRLTVAAEARIVPTALGALLRARDVAGRTTGAVWAQLRPGNVAVVWPTQWLAPPPAGPDPLLAALLATLTATGVTLAQSLLPDTECAEARALESVGFSHLADLEYLGADVRTAEPHGAQRAESLSFVRPTPAERLRMAALIERTYQGTLDCPALNGLRTAGEVLDEYETVGESGSQLWYFVRHDEADVGCLLLAEHSQQDQVELVYMALLPEARGNGWGEITARESLRIAATLGRSRVAAALYRRAGFHAWERRSVFVKSLVCSSAN